MFIKIVKIFLIPLACIITLGVINAYVFVPDLRRHGEIVAYRGGGSAVNYEKLNKTGCTSLSIKASRANSVENTLEAVASSIAAGAKVIHLNVHKTSDDQLVVFHDWTLDCATNGSGPVHKTSFEQLKSIDAGYGYTFDDGATFPFRGKGFEISKLEAFYKRYPKYEFWLNLKNNDIRSFETLYEYLSGKIPNHIVITSSKGMEWFRNKDPSLRLASVDSVKNCAIGYLLVGWAGLVPESCRNTVLFIPPSMTKYFWGYPERLASRLQSYGSDVYLWSRHEPITQPYNDVVASGIGVITSDLDFIRATQADKRINQDVISKE
ncbi:glycerophosphodiester phosphodiesterase [Pseudoalteromonas sp. McH1-7]|uniref:glycerophosphodiester phosphodiesterase family protein n=1 Tax=Pseudoalteromonas sp. McH1-7 TaxID=2745574 RepID=UPI001590A3A8|nr:glycerophosphodiester phosphodiesterase family protein [Pseudoalteromonas sp. McH1-7]NUZ09273.1 glycerophosphodiester phosphodiesterase [Pseudoalteromonas sp. McH1-7]